MPRVICELPNVSDEISGVRFQKLDDGRFISDEIGDEATQIFLSIPGYVADEEGHEEEDDTKDEVPPAKTKAQLKAEAAEQIKANKLEKARVAEEKAEQEKAEKEAAEKLAEQEAADKVAREKEAAEGSQEGSEGQKNDDTPETEETTDKPEGETGEDPVF